MENTQLVCNVNGHAITDSRVVAESFGKQHAHVMRDIQALECSDEFSQSNFGLAEYTDAQGKPRPCYHLSRDGFTFLAMGFTGKKAARFKIKYIEAFNSMEKALDEGAAAARAEAVSRKASGRLATSRERGAMARMMNSLRRTRGAEAANAYYDREVANGAPFPALPRGRPLAIEARGRTEEED